MIKNFTEVKPLRYWVQHILPLVYDDSLSYMELLGKVVNTLNEVVKNNNMLPDYIMELIKEYISSGEFEKVLASVLANYMLNVKFPPAGLKPATGDGSADDTEAIQGCIDYAYNNGGMSVYFPSGSYLTQPLTLRDKAILFGQDRYTTRLVMKGGATTAMFTGDVDELTLTGLGFDGNMDIQVNNVNLFTISVNSAIITNCLLTDGYDLLNITVNDDLQLNNVIFRHAVENALVLKGAGIVQGNNLIFKSVSALVGKNFVVMDVSKSILEQLKCYGASPNAVLINGSNNVVKMWNEQSLKAYTDNGANNTVEVYTQSEQKKLTGFKTTDVNGDLTETIGGNHTKTVTGDISESASNFKMVIQLAYELTASRLTEQLTSKEVNATNSTENLGNKTETITGEKEVNANGSTENIANEKHVIAGSVTEDITGDKHVNAANIVETVQGDKTLTAGDISETAVNKTLHITQDNTEQIDGTKTTTVIGDYIGKFGEASFETGSSSWLVKFPDKTVDLHDIEKNKSSFVNVLDFGAKGDGITDDTDAFKNAIEYCISNNVGLYVPAVGNWNQEGGYILSATLNIDYPMSFVCAPNALLNWKNAHLNTNDETTIGRNGATKYNSGFGINIDYGTYRGHKGYYSFGIVQGDKSYTYPGGTAPSGRYWTGVRVANGDLIDLNIRYLSYWECGILITSDKDYTANNRINLLVCDDCQTGVTFSPANNNAIDVTEFYFNTIGICKYGIVFESDGANSSSFSRTNNLRVRGSQIYTEYKNGACLYNTAAFEEAIVNADIDIMCLFNNRTQETTIKTGDTSTWYGKCVTGTQTISGNNDTFGAHDSRFSIGVYNGPMTAGQPININIGGWGNEIINKWQKFHGTANTPALLIMTHSEADFNGGIGGCLPGRTAFVSWTTDKSYVANETVTLYAYAMCLTASGVTPMSVMEVENYGLFDTIIKSDTYSAARQFFITIKFRTEVAPGYKFDFLVKINDIN